MCIGISIALLFVAIAFTSCEKSCELETEYTVAITADTNLMDMHGPLWSAYSSTDARDAVMNGLHSQFGGTSNLILETGPADVHIFINSIHTDSYEWDESRTDPCYGDHGWLYQSICPPTVYTYRLHLTEVSITYTVVDSVHMTTGYGTAFGKKTESLYQPTGDSTQCFQYEITGAYDPALTISSAVGEAFKNMKCEIKKMMEPD